MAEELSLHTLKPAQARKDRKRVGRGLGSGKGRYSGRGIKGQKSRAGSHKMPAEFEGGQTRIFMRLPKLRGNTSKDAMPVGPFRTFTVPVNVAALDVFDDGAEVTPESLVEKGLIKNTRIDVKLLGQGELKKKLTRPRACDLCQRAREGRGCRRQRRPAQGAEGRRRRSRRSLHRRRPQTLSQSLSPSPKRPKPPSPGTRGVLGAFLARERLARSGAPASRPLHVLDARPLPAGLVDPGAGRRLRDDQAVLRRSRRHDPRPAERLLGRRAVAVRPVRARDHAVRHGLDHLAAHDRGRAEARAAAEGRRVGLRQDQPVHALPHRRPRGRAGDGIRLPVQARGEPRRQHRPHHPDRRHADRRDDAPHVDGRADHEARRRQRHLAADLRVDSRVGADRRGRLVQRRHDGAAVLPARRDRASLPRSSSSRRASGGFRSSTQNAWWGAARPRADRPTCRCA